MNTAQELFLVLFSILYGVMLQSLSGLQPFPLARTFRGHIERDGNPKTKFFYCGNKSNKDLIKMWWKRVGYSFILLNFFPLLYFFGILFLLSNTSISSSFSSLSDFINVIFIFWSALGVFGFYRFYHAIAVCCWKSLFCDVTREIEKRGTSFNARAHFIWAWAYLLPPLHYLIAFNYFLKFPS